MKKEDLRIQKTRRDLRRALLTLMKKDKFEKITVTQICTQAMINRMTFYKHYEDKYHLLNDTLQFFKDSVISETPIKPKFNTREDAIAYIKTIANVWINEVNNHKDLVELIANQQDVAFNQLISGIVYDGIEEILVTINEFKTIRYPIKLLSAFLNGGISSTIYYWLNNQGEYPKDELIKQVNEIITDAGNLVFIDKN